MSTAAVERRSPLVLATRPALAEDMGWLRSTFLWGVKASSNRMHKLPWSTFRRDVRPELYAELDAATRLVAVVPGGQLAGWLAFTRGKRVDTVHWLCVRPEYQGQGVAADLVDRAQLRDRIVYTHRGPKRSDERLARWLERRGAVSVVYTPLKEWL